MRRGLLAASTLVLLALPPAIPGQESALTPEVRAFVTLDAPAFALTHVRVVDGTGAPAVEDQTIVVRGGKIEAVGPADKTSAPAGATVLDRSGYTVLPGLVMLHEHFFYALRAGGPGGVTLSVPHNHSFPRMYFAGGLTSLRTGGSIEPYTDLAVKTLIDQGRIPGPKVHVTGPYLEGTPSIAPQLRALSGPDEARRLVEYWADAGVTSFKAYMHATRAELAAAVEAAHKRKLKVTGHLCAVGFREAAEIGIDNLEHGLLVDTEFVAGKKPDVCPSQLDTLRTIAEIDVAGAPVQETIRELVRRGVAVTSTLPVFEISVPNRPPLDQRVLDALAPGALTDYLTRRARIAESSSGLTAAFQKEMQFERDFAKAGGLLVAGTDPTGYGGVVAGYGSQREVELLVEAGFSPVEAIKIASSNGARYLGESDTIGTIAPGKQADLLLIKGNPAAQIADLRKLEWVFKDGVAYDSAKLFESVRGQVGTR